MAALSNKTKRLRAEILALVADRVLVPKRAYLAADMLVRKTAQANPTRRKHEYWCSACGGKFDTPLDKPHVCPHCGATLKYSHDHCRLTFKDEHFIREFVTYGDWQVVKEYIAETKHRSGSAAEVDLWPAYMWWYKPSEGATLLLASYLKMCAGWCRIPFSRYSGFRFINSKVGEASYWYSDWRDVTLGKPKILEWFRVRGFTEKEVATHVAEQTLAAYTAHPTILETLRKTGQESAAALFVRNTRYRRMMMDNWRPWCIARRHGFDIEAVGARTYLDYLDQLRTLHRDRRNPVFICPHDFGAAHAETTRKVSKILDARAARANATRLERDAAYQARLQAERLERMERERKGFNRRIKKFAALVITDENLSIRPLLSVDEFKAEGEAMQHCVWANAYYARPESLILSAKDRAGQRVETVEVDIKDWRIVQSRAFRNGMSKYHDEIMELVNAAMPHIKELSKVKRTRQSA